MTDRPAPLSSDERAELDRLRADQAAREESARKAWDYYQASTCACTAAERYMPDCSKHGFQAKAPQ